MKPLRLAAEGISALLFIISLIVTVGCIYIDISEKISGEMKFFSGYKLVYIESGSMEPVIRTGSFILLRQAEYEDVEIGDIITFRTSGGYVTHRLTGIDRSALEAGDRAYLITKGDANNVEDPERLDPELICGVYEKDTQNKVLEEEDEEKKHEAAY